MSSLPQPLFVRQGHITSRCCPPPHPTPTSLCHKWNNHQAAGAPASSGHGLDSGPMNHGGRKLSDTACSSNCLMIGTETARRRLLGGARRPAHVAQYEIFRPVRGVVNEAFPDHPARAPKRPRYGSPVLFSRPAGACHASLPQVGPSSKLSWTEATALVRSTRPFLSPVLPSLPNYLDLLDSCQILHLAQYR